MAGKTVCVTGGAGYVASWIIKFLLQRGYTVKASVRYPDDPKKTHHLLALEGAKERLHLMKADLLEKGSFDALVDSCEGVFHCASPFFFDCKDPQAELLDPALKGTLNVLGSVAKTPSVKRVVLTSSEAAVAFNGTPLTPEVEIDETWWSNPDYCRNNQLWYVLSKTIAEKAAWEFVKEKGIDMVSINPTCIIGPLLQPTLNTSCANILHLINGSETFPNATYGWIDVRDVANAHILAFEKPEASGRYLMVERGVNFSEIVKILRGHYPHLKLPEKPSDDKPLTPSYRASRKKTESLGIVYTPIEQSIKDTAESLKEKGLFKGDL
jgi:nucleoside-diphosphate-sugar epimerase